MKNRTKLGLSILSFGAAALSLVGGTFAWFSINATAVVSWSGTIINTGEQMRVGLKAKDDSFDPTGLELTADTTDGTIFWAHSQRLENNAMKAVMNYNGYFANSVLAPVTSGSFGSTYGTTLTLKDHITNKDGIVLSDADSLNSDLTIMNTTAAPKANYMQFTLVFEVYEELTVGTPTPVAGKKILFGADQLYTAGIQTASLALRMAVDGHDETGAAIDTFLLAPAASSTVTTKVGGTLDLSLDGYKDYAYVNDSGTMKTYELYYGEATSAIAWDANPAATDVGTKPGTPNLDSFKSATKKGNYFISDAVVAKTAVAATLANYKAGGSSYLAKTDNNGRAEITFTMWLEGWDVNCINAIALTTVNAVMSFAASN